jgi:hypothetical protein
LLAEGRCLAVGPGQASWLAGSEVIRVVLLPLAPTLAPVSRRAPGTPAGAELAVIGAHTRCGL